MIMHNGIEWINYHGVLMPNTAPHICIALSKDDIKYLLKVSNAYFIRWISDWDTNSPTQFWHVINDEDIPLEALSANTRSKIRRSLKHCSFKKTTLDTIINEGYPVYYEAFKRYRTHLKLLDKESFILSLKESNQGEKWEYWEARDHENKLLAYSLNKCENNMCAYKTIKFDPNFPNYYVSEGLFYSMNHYYLNIRQRLYVDDGSRSLSHQTNIQTFLINKFKFRKAYCTLNIVYSFKVKVILTLLYPFKPLLEKMSIGVIQKIVVLLKHEEIRRSFETKL